MSSISNRHSMAPPASQGASNTTSVQVAVRIRPVTNADQGSIPTRWQRSVLSPLGVNSLQIDQGAAPPASGGAASASAPGRKQTFNFDRVLSPSDGQAQVYSSVAEPLIGRFLEGYNVTILAYGQTSSGKSYTMGTAIGDVDYESLVAGGTPDPQMGIIPRAVGQIFSQMKLNMSKSGAVQYSAKASFIEIYNEDLIDLLADHDGDSRPLVQIREGKGGQIIWSGLREVKVQNVAEVMNYLEQGSQIRRTNETDMNAQSSRSHAIFSLTLTQRKYVGSGPPPPPSAANGVHPPSSFGGRTTPSASGTGSIGRSGLPRPASGIPSRALSPTMNGSRPNTPSIHGNLPVPSGRNSATGLRPPSVVGMRSINSSGADASAGTQEGDWVTVTSKFHFVDLAGSERLKRTAASGERAKEGISINSGLHALGNVISALGDPSKAKKTTHIPYRDSKLTRLLQDSLGGNAHTLMIACVSPTEYNISETTNTLQYANRAKNIKNKAELNEVEVGWDDIEYLQTLVTKLRKDLTAIKNSKGLEGSSAVSDSARGVEITRLQKEILDWKDKYAAVQQQLAQITTEKVKLEQQQKGSNDDMSFLQAAEPIVIEYEKTIDMLEGEKNLIKAARAQLEEMNEEAEKLIEEQSSQLAANKEELESKDRKISSLTQQLATVQADWRSNEAHIEDLESKLTKGVSDAEIVSQLKQEIAGLKHSASSRESWVKRAETDLAKSQERGEELQAKIAVLERNVASERGSKENLRKSMELMKSGEENKSLLHELEDRESRVSALERDLEKAASEKERILQDHQKLTESVASHQSERSRLEAKVRSLETAGAAGVGVGVAALGAGALKASTNGVSSSDREAPEATSEDSDPRPSELATLKAELETLRERDALSKSNLETLQAKYDENLRELEDLNHQLSEAKLISGPMAPSSPLVGDPEQDDDIEVLAPASQGSRRNSYQLSPSRSSSSLRRPKSLRIDSRPESLRDSKVLARRSSGTFLGYKTDSPSMPSLAQTQAAQQRAAAAAQLSSGRATPDQESPRRRSHSQSLSQELSRGPRPLSLSGTVPPSPFFKQPEPSSPASYERTIASLEKQTKQLQDALKERDEEVLALEARIKSGGGALPSIVSHSAEPSSLNGEVGSNDVSGSLSAADSALTPSTETEFSAIRNQLLQDSAAGDSPEHHVARLDDLMRSMARKDASHREALESTGDQISHLEKALSQARKEKEELQTLNRDQMANMSSELERLRAQLAERSDPLLSSDKGLSPGSQEELAALKLEMFNTKSELDKKDLDHKSQLQNLEKQISSERSIRDASHESTLADLNRVHAEALAAASSGNSDAAQRSLEEHQAKIFQLQDDHSKALQAREAELTAALSHAETSHQSSLAALEERYAAEKEDAQQAWEKERRDLISQSEAQAASHSEAISKLESQMARKASEHSELLQRKTEEHELALSSLKDQHARSLAVKDEEHASALGNADLARQSSLAETEEERNLLLEKLQGEHKSQVERLKGEHEETLSRSLASKDASHQSVLRDHEASIRALQEDHSAALQQLEAAHTSALSKREGEHAAFVDQLKNDHLSALEKQASEHQLAIQELKEFHTSEIERLGSEHKTALAAAIDAAAVAHSKAREESEATLQEQHRSALTELQAQSESKLAEVMNALRKEHEEESNKLRSEHQSSLSALETEHAGKLAALQAEHATALPTGQSDTSTLQESHARAVEALQNEHSTFASKAQAQIEKLQTDHQSAQERLESIQTQHQAQMASIAEGHNSALSEAEGRLQQATRERDEIRAAHAELEKTHKAWTEKEQDPEIIDRLQIELADTSEALLTFENAMTEAQRERDVLAEEIAQLRANGGVNGSANAMDAVAAVQKELDHHRVVLANVKSELTRSKSDIISLTDERSRQDSLLRELQVKLAMAETRAKTSRESHIVSPSAEHPNGDFGGRSPIPRGASDGPESATSSSNDHRGSRGGGSGKPPPPTPPPNMPPPPTPTLPNGATTPTQRNSAGHRTSSSSINTRPDSPGTLTRSSSTTSMNGTSPSINGYASGVSDPKTAKILMEQAEELKDLTKRLNHCEADLSANIDLVATLEAALNDSERNLRKSRAQLVEATRERERFGNENDDLKRELSMVTNELETLKNSTARDQQQHETELRREKQAKENARRDLEIRMEEMRKKKSGNKFMCI